MNETALIVRESLDPAVLFTDTGMDEVLAKIKSEATSYAFTANDDQGRKDIASLAYRVARSKTIIDDMGKEIVSDWKKKAKVIDEQRKKARDFLDGLKEEVRAPLAEWEAEQARIKAEEEAREREKIDARIAALAQVNCVLSSFDITAMTDDEFDEKLATATAEYEEKQRLAEQARLAEEAAQRAEKERMAAERAELEALRAEQEKIRKEQAEKDRIEREKMAEEARKLDEERQAIQAEKDRMERERFEAEAKERARIQAENYAKEKVEREAAERERQREILPDKEKLLLHADNITSLSAYNLDVKSGDARELFYESLDRLMKIDQWFRIKIEEL